MKSKISIQSSLILFVTFMTISCSKNNDSYRSEFHGKVKSCNEKYFAAENKFGEWTCGDSNSFYLEHYSFTDEGIYNGTEYYDQEGKLNLKSIPKYTEGKLVNECMYNQDGKLIEKTIINQISTDVDETITFDENGRKKNKSKSHYKKDQLIAREYDMFENGKPAGKRICKIVNDSKGNIQTFEIVDEKGKEESYARNEYLEFDKMKNWIKKITFNSKDSKKPDYFIIREFEYY